jgi:hypothetical protein
VGFKVPLTNESEFVSQIEKTLTDLAGNRDLLNRLRKQGLSYARERLTWDAKAQRTTQVLNWAVRRGPKPDFPPPKVLHLTCGPDLQPVNASRLAAMPPGNENLSVQ